MFIEIPASNYSLVKRKPICGIGINDAKYVVSPVLNGIKLFCPYYRTWSDMITRCYSSKFHDKNTTYSNCTTITDWHIFSNFKSWMLTQNWEGKALDKDLLKDGNKIYSPECCIFVSQQLNNLLMSRSSARGKYPQGVSVDKRINSFVASCAVYGKAKRIGCYKTPEEASAAYKQFKSKHILEVAEEYKNEPRLYEALKNHSRMMLL